MLVIVLGFKVYLIYHSLSLSVIMPYIYWIRTRVYLYIFPPGLCSIVAIGFTFVLTSVHFSSVTQSCLTFATPWTAVCQASLSFTISWSLFKLMSIESVMPANHFLLCCSLLLLPSILPSIRVFSNGLASRIRWPSIGASASVSILPMNIQIDFL